MGYHTTSQYVYPRGTEMRMQEWACAEIIKWVFLIDYDLFHDRTPMSEMITI